MKRNFIVIIVAFIFVGCGLWDEFMYYDYFIVNECDENINVYVETNPRLYPYQDPKNIVILPHESALIYQINGINVLLENPIDTLFVEITIQKGDQTSKLNYINNNMWKFEPDSKNHANSYLTIYPDHFE